MEANENELMLRSCKEEALKAMELAKYHRKLAEDQYQQALLQAQIAAEQRQQVQKK